MLVHGILLYTKIKLTFVFCHFWNCTHFWIRLLQIPKYLFINQNSFLKQQKNQADYLGEADVFKMYEPQHLAALE